MLREIPNHVVVLEQRLRMTPHFDELQVVEATNLFSVLLRRLLEAMLE